MDLDVSSILNEDDLDIQILDEKIGKTSTSYNSAKPVVQEVVKTRNPVEQKIIQELHYINNLVNQTRNNIIITQTVTENVLQNISSKFAYQEDVSSDSDSDCYLSTGEPVLKIKKNKSYEKKQVIEIKDIWQRVVADKWIIGVILQNTTTCKLQEPTIYICRNDEEDSSNGVFIFWTLHDNKIWIPTDEIGPKEELVATVVLDLPCFDNRSAFQTSGTILCQFGDKLFQTPVPEIELDAENTVDGSCDIDFDDEDRASASVLSLKAVSVDRVVLLPMQENTGTGKRLTQFLDAYSFTEICKVCVMRNIGTIEYCLLEVLPADDADIRVLLSAKSEAQLSVMVKLMQAYLPELLDVEKQEAVNDAVEALMQELQLYLTCSSATELQRARIKTDLLIP